MKKRLFLLLISLSMLTFQGCNRASKDQNPFFSEWDTPFQVPPFDRIKASHYAPAILEGIARHNAEIDSIVTNSEVPSFGNVIEAMDRSGSLLSRAYTTFVLINSADSNEELQQIDMEVSPRVSAHYDAIFMNDRLFEKVKTIYDQRETLNLEPQQRRLTEIIYQKFVRSGALLPSDQKETLRSINEELTRLSIQFGNNVLAENNSFALILEKEEDLEGLPDYVRISAKQEAQKRGLAEKWVYTLSKPSMIPFLTYASRSDLRERLYRAYLDRCSHGDSTDNRAIVNEIVKLRLQRANLMGYTSHAAFTLDNTMAKTPEKVFEFLDQMWTPALELSKTELEEMRSLKLTETGINGFIASDWWFYAERVRRNKYSLDEDMLRPYFSLGNVTQGIFQLSNRLWGITFRPVPLPVYNEECFTYEVLDRDNSHLGVLYLDFFPREGKRGGAWCGTFRDPHYKNGQRVAPIVTIVCNFTRPTHANAEALLSPEEVETYFHEFGHALHKLFSQVKYEGLDEVERDFVELPSQIMENWAFEPQVLKMYARHHQNGEMIPEALIQKIRASGRFNQGFLTLENLAASISDMEIHSLEKYNPLEVDAFERNVLNQKRGLIPEIEPRYRYPYFSHIFDGGYSAGYYSYKWAEVLDKDAFEAFVESGDIFNKTLAQAFRDKVLSQGHIKDGMELYIDFRGQEPDIKPLMRKQGLIPDDRDSTVMGITPPPFTPEDVLSIDSQIEAPGSSPTASRDSTKKKQ